MLIFKDMFSDANLKIDMFLSVCLYLSLSLSLFPSLSIYIYKYVISLFCEHKVYSYNVIKPSYIQYLA